MQYPEYQEQKSFIGWCHLVAKTIPELVAFKYFKIDSKTKLKSLHVELNIYSNNNTQILNKQQAARHKALGSGIGVPDIFVAIPKTSWNGLYMEFKAPSEKPKTDKGKGGLSEVQILRIDSLRKNNYRVEVVYSWLEAKNILLNYLGIK